MSMADDVKKTVCGILITIALAWVAWASVGIITLYADAAVSKTQYTTICDRLGDIKVMLSDHVTATAPRRGRD